MQLAPSCILTSKHDGNGADKGNDLVTHLLETELNEGAQSSGIGEYTTARCGRACHVADAACMELRQSLQYTSKAVKHNSDTSLEFASVYCYLHRLHSHIRHLLISSSRSVMNLEKHRSMQSSPFNQPAGYSQDAIKNASIAGQIAAALARPNLLQDQAMVAVCHRFASLDKLDKSANVVRCQPA